MKQDVARTVWGAIWSSEGAAALISWRIVKTEITKQGSESGVGPGDPSD